MKVFLIDPTTRTVKEINIEDGLKPMYDAIGNGCDLVEAPFSYDNGDTLYIDEEGTYHENIGGFMYKDWAYPCVGRGLVIGVDWENGESQNANSTLEEVKENLIFLSKDDPKIITRFW